MKRILRAITVAMLVATVLVVASVPALARPRLGGVPLQNEEVCLRHVVNHPLTGIDRRFELRTTSAVLCWHVSPGLAQASDVVPPT